MLRNLNFVGIFILGFILSLTTGCNKKDGPTDSEPDDELITLRRHVIDDNFAGIHAIKVIDLDRDGDLDVVGGSEITPNTQSRGMAWWRNDGGNPPQWTRYSIDASYVHVMSVDVYDIDGDSHLDIAATSWSRHDIVWWKNSGNAAAGWTRFTIETEFTNSHDAQCGDLNGDGHTDVAGISSGGDVQVFFNNGANPPGWNDEVLSTTFAGGKTILIHDLDQDGDPDLVGTAADADRIYWWENGGGNPINWFVHSIAEDFVGSSGIDVVDLNDDGGFDVIGSAWKSDEISYWISTDVENDLWQKNPVTTALDVPAKVRGVDIDLDGDIDIVVTAKIPGELAIYFNENMTWTKHSIQSDFDGGTALSVVDFDGDGDPDIFAGASYAGELYWWENVR